MYVYLFSEYSYTSYQITQNFMIYDISNITMINIQLKRTTSDTVKRTTKMISILQFRLIYDQYKIFSDF